MFLEPVGENLPLSNAARLIPINFNGTERFVSIIFLRHSTLFQNECLFLLQKFSVGYAMQNFLRWREMPSPGICHLKKTGQLDMSE